MLKKYRVKNNPLNRCFGLKSGDIVTKIEGSTHDNLYELPKHLHGNGHNADIHDKHLNLKDNYIYLSEDDLEEIEKQLKESEE